ncbi:short tail fibers protein [Acinetobacter phage vB_AbaM_PhT2]|uniref:Short tail fibers protein n=1 Tax=Acinetobacter phage vB_AbaM_PhT2 TaxID=2690230 RepID=A0A6B9SVW7_9CAUD|nr:tail collar fiber protein [Acinetobacter phage vB_AbaM_PhT2]QHJ75776.1 short tail fibers protein [Acinetobacter phage vB_AbaM_PhT2]
MAFTPLNNTYKHIADDAKYISFDPVGTNFPATVKDVQSALKLTSPTAYATTTQPGVVTLATHDEVLAGTDKEKVVTPFTLSERLKFPDATISTKGIVTLATNDEANAGTLTVNKVINPASLKYTLDQWWKKFSSETAYGVIRLSTQQAAQAGVDDSTAMTPLKVKQAIAAATANIPQPTTASENAPGLVQLATIGQAQAGTLRDGYAISPYTLQRIIGSLTTRGLVQAATLAQANLGTDDTLYISAKGFQTYNASNSNYGTVKLVDTLSTNGEGLALSSNAKVLGTNLNSTQSVSGTVNFTGNLQKNGSDVASAKDIKDNIPIGTVMQWLGENNPPGGLWKICDGPVFNKNEYPELFDVIGYRFGGNGDTFYGPDMRGLFLRGVGSCAAIVNDRGYDSKGLEKLGNWVSGGSLGEIQKQQQRKHKHVIPWGDEYRSSWTGAYGASVLNKYIGMGRNSKSYTDMNNFAAFSNDAKEIEDAEIRDYNGTLNTEGAIGYETRPWNMSVNYIIKVA